MDLPGQAVRRRGLGRSTRLNVCLATCSALPAGDPEIAGRFAFDVAAWDDPRVDWGAYDLVVVRSTWDWSWRAEEFLAWVHSVPRLANDADVIEWNSDKTYLRALHAAGIPTIPSRWGPCDVPEGRWVVKPRIGAGARGITRVDGGAHVESHQFAQPYLDGIDEHGETALVYFDGALSHVAGKGAVLGHLRRDDGAYDEDQVTPRTPSVAEVELADAVLDAIPFDRASLLYARVDLVPDRDGDPVLLELELMEPSLFLDMAVGAHDRFEQAILRRL